MWDTVTREVGEAREKELPSHLFKLALTDGAQMDRHLNTVQSAHHIIRRAARNHLVVMSTQRELVDEPKDIVDTTAEGVTNRELDERTRQHRDELKRVQEYMIQALKEKDEQLRKELEEDKRRLWEWMRARLIEIEQEAREEKRRTEAQLADLNRRLQDLANASAVDRARLEQEARERERVGAEHGRQLADLTRRLQGEATADRARLEQETEKLQERTVTTPPHVPPRQISYVQVLFCSATHDG